MFTVDTKITKELIEKFDEEDGVFYRFQNKNYDIDGDYTGSFGMIFGSPEEARECADEWGMTEEEAVLSGKSCMPTFEDIMRWCQEFDNDSVLLVFDGVDTYESGHDDEYVAEYIAPRAVIDFDEAVKYWEENYE